MPQPQGPGARVGQTFGHGFLVGDLIHESPYGETYHATGGPSTSGSPVRSITVLHADIGDHPAQWGNFEADLEEAETLHYPDLSRCLGYQLAETPRWFAQEWLDGGVLLRDLLRQGGPLPPRSAFLLTARIARALDILHARRICHRNLNSGSILLGRANIRTFLDKPDRATHIPMKVIGWATAHLVAARDPIARTQKNPNAFLGYAEYMAPEQAQGKPADQRSDVYALGVLLYEMLTGKPPFTSEDIATTLKRHIYEKPLLPKLARPELLLTDEEEDLIMTAMAKRPEERFETMPALCGALAGAGFEFKPPQPRTVDPLPEQAKGVQSPPPAAAEPSPEPEPDTAEASTTPPAASKAAAATPDADTSAQDAPAETDQAPTNTPEVSDDAEGFSLGLAGDDNDDTGSLGDDGWGDIDLSAMPDLGLATEAAAEPAQDHDAEPQADDAPSTPSDPDASDAAPNHTRKLDKPDKPDTPADAAPEPEAAPAEDVEADSDSSEATASASDDTSADDSAPNATKRLSKRAKKKKGKKQKRSAPDTAAAEASTPSEDDDFDPLAPPPPRAGGDTRKLSKDETPERVAQPEPAEPEASKPASDDAAPDPDTPSDAKADADTSDADAEAKDATDEAPDGDDAEAKAEDAPEPEPSDDASSEEPDVGAIVIDAPASEGLDMDGDWFSQSVTESEPVTPVDDEPYGKSNNAFLIASVVVLLLLGLGGVYYMSQKSAPADDPEGDTKALAEHDESARVKRVALLVQVKNALSADTLVEPEGDCAYSHLMALKNATGGPASGEFADGKAAFIKRAEAALTQARSDNDAPKAQLLAQRIASLDPDHAEAKAALSGSGAPPAPLEGATPDADAAGGDPDANAEANPPAAAKPNDTAKPTPQPTRPAPPTSAAGSADDNAASGEPDDKAPEGNTPPAAVPDPPPAPVDPIAAPKTDASAERKAELERLLKEASSQRGQAAIDAYEKVIKLDPRNHRAWFQIGTNLNQQSRYADAVRYLERAVQLNPRSAYYRLYLGNAYLKTGDNARAKQQYQKVLELDENNKAAKRMLDKLK